MKARFHRKHRRGGGFTLMETALAVVIIGVGVMSLLQLIATDTVANLDATQMTSGTNLAADLREYTMSLTFDQARALAGTQYNPPIDSRGQPIAAMSDWTQSVTAQPVDPSKVTLNVVSFSPAAVRMTAAASRRGTQISSVQWYLFK